MWKIPFCGKKSPSKWESQRKPDTLPNKVDKELVKYEFERRLNL